MKTEYILGTAVAVAIVGGVLVAKSENENIKKLLGKGKDKKVEPAKISPAKTNNFVAYNSANGISPRSSKSHIIRLQKRLIDAGHLAPTQRTKSGAMVSSADGIWGNDTNIALSKVGLSSPVTEMQLNSIKKASGGGNSSNDTVSESNEEIAHFVGKEMTRSRVSINYEAIYEKIKNLKNSDIQAIDVIYRKEYSTKGLKKDIQLVKDGGLVEWETMNSKAIRDIVTRAGLSGLGEINYTVRTKQNCIIEDPKKGNVVVDKNVILGKVVLQNANGKMYIETINGGQIMANAHDVVTHK